MDIIKNHISATLKEGVIASILPVSKSTKPVYKTITKSSFEDIIRLQPNEKILVVQRQHLITLFTPFFYILIIFVFSLVGLFSIQIQSYFTIPEVLIWDILVVVVCFLTTFGIFSYLYWYYQFYIITNKCILHRHFFRLGGHHSEEVFLETSPEREIKRAASNFLYSLLDIENVEVSFQRPGIGDFVFEAPENPQEIEDILEKISYERKI